MTLPHGATLLPTFMPVATQASMKGVTPAQLMALDPPLTLMLNNTYHLSQRPTPEILDLIGGSHTYQGWDRNLLSDSGGFQVSFSWGVKLSKVEEEGVVFANPYDPTKSSLLTPERSMQIQHSIGTDIMMQLDDVVATLTTGARMEEAMWRSVRWLDRCIAEHERSGRRTKQNLFAIVQGGLDPVLRQKCLDAMLSPERQEKLPGYAIGGLSGGEEKTQFWRIVAQCAAALPEQKPRCELLTSFPLAISTDLLVCAALGVDMADCVFPTRTARFGVALTFDGPVDVRRQVNATDFSVIDPECTCPTCDKGNGMTKAALSMIAGRETVGAHALTLHNLTYQSTLMHRAREAILEDRFPQYLIDFFARFFKTNDKYPAWAVEALLSVGVDLLSGVPSAGRKEISRPN
ncbi:queuine tRNA-ribosyltransferase [Microbotryum lychnidis-dioicae p1A1 Lamole]|uniref:Queuine tRNA-ribosyltransferase n=1 Tax=Microbotryum lychnidis-dioicae (strain p1A1 Lamole / MvSl-1064) TaxID=683840 RepID=U5H446_USTV1|nr:queuine tRNA-ribosyltransferase [Microbotryum lychnidis-dioicae p1A1 Lamole]|eukprot:KDE07631.1 queuine tRNA-ribosyltransferase [Microbotryum lychnidis-dioicae p1A1 Lamole]